MNGRRIDSDKVSVDGKLVGRYFGSRTEVKLISSVDGTSSLIVSEEMSLVDGRDVATKGTSEVSELGEGVG